MAFRNQVSAHIRTVFKLEGKAKVIPAIKLTSDVMNECKDKSLADIKKYIADHKPALQKKMDAYIKKYV